MAQIERREGKRGVSYLLTVYGGKDASGKQIRHRKTFAPPQTWSEARQEKAAWKAANDFEDEIKKGYQADNRQTFSEYAGYVIALKRREGKTKESTLELYEILLERINPEIGHLKLSDIRPSHLNNLYAKLAKSGNRKSAVMAKAKIDLAAELKKHQFTQKKMAEAAGVSVKAISQACKAPVSKGIAEKISSVLGVRSEKIFSFEQDTSPLSAKTVLEHHRLISTVLAQAEREMIVPYNAATKATPPHPQKKEPNYFQQETVFDILDAVEQEPLKYQVFVNLAVVTGARRGELAGLKWENIDFSTGKVSINHALYYSGKRGVYQGLTKTGEHRSSKIPMEVITLLKQLRAEQAELRLRNGDRWNDLGYIFTQDNGLPVHPDTWTTWLDRFSKRHGLPHINPHAFRHTVASVLIANQVDDVTVSKVLGHSDPNTTRSYYAHLIDQAKATAEETITDVLIRRKA